MQQAQFPLPQSPIQRPAGGGKIALLYGLIFGGAVSLLDILYTVLVENGVLTWYYGLVGPLERLPYILSYMLSSILVSLPIYIFLFLAFFLAGLLAARSARRVATGVLAGLFAGAVFLILDLFVGTLLITFLIVILPEMSSGGLINTAIQILLNGAIYSLIIDLILLGLGALIGFLGGLVGNNGNPQASSALPYTYPGQPPSYGYPPAQPGQPLPPAQPGQPLPSVRPGQPSSPPPSLEQ